MKNNLNICKKVGLCFFVSALFFGGFWIDSVLAGIEDYSVVANNTFIQTGGGVGNYDLPFPSQPIVTVSDDQGNQVVGALVVATKVTGTGSIRNATTTTDSSGQANFTTLGYSKSGESFVIKFVAIIGTSTVESATSTVNAMSTGTNNSLRWVTSPAISSYISANWTSFSIEILDAAGDRVATSSDIVTIAGANLAGTLSTTTVNGLATFNDVLATATGTLTIIGTSAGLTSTASSSSVTVYSAPNNVSLSAATSTLSVGSSTILTATIKDAYGDVVTSDNSTTVTFATSTANGTISSSSVQVVNGIATTSLNRVGSGLFSVTATSTALTGASLSYTAIAPSTITQTSGSGTSNVLSWTHSKGVSTIVYSIYRSTSASVTATTSNLIGTSTSATYTDNTTSALTSYYYNVTAVDNSSDASALSTELRLCSTKTTTNGTIASDCAITCNTPDYILSGNSCVSASTNVVLSGASTLAVSGSTTLTATIKDASNNTMTTDNSSIVAFTISNANGTISTSSAQVASGVATISLIRVGSGLLSVTATSTALTGSSLGYSAIAPSAITQDSGIGTSTVLSWTHNTGSSTIVYSIYRSASASVTATTSNLIGTSTSATYTDTTTSDFTSYYYNVTAVDNSSNASALSTELRLCSTKTITNGTVAASCAISCSSGYTVGGNTCAVNQVVYTPWNGPVSSSGGGGGGGSANTIVANTTLPVVIANTDSIVAPPVAIIENITPAVPSKDLIKNTESEVSVLASGDINAFAIKAGQVRNLEAETAVMNKYVDNLTAGQTGVDNKTKSLIVAFINYGTPTTQVLGAGERAGTLSSYEAAFGKLPATEKDWQDAIKIGNGRWPSERNSKAEAVAAHEFEEIYLRQPNLSVGKDGNAVMVMAYGLRPANRSLESERKATEFFKDIHAKHGHLNEMLDWDVIRAIAYSGAIR